uniref:EH domain-containing protein n=1 Tax=Eptatretus burgeri TaxID=7764 RepID=A0A8C4Q4P1_EPTBU
FESWCRACGPSFQEALWSLYQEKLLPLEKASSFHAFHGPSLHQADFGSKSLVLLLGPPGAGKTSFLRYLLQEDYPGLRSAPGHGTDAVTIVSYGPRAVILPGHTVVLEPSLPLASLGSFGSAFLSRLVCAQLPCPVLKAITFVDTPGIVAGDGPISPRGYDLPEVLLSLASRADRILLMVDAQRLDFSAELSMMLRSLRRHHRAKLRVLLNKSDLLSAHELLRAYGALTWCLGRAVGPAVAESPRIHVGSFWGEPLRSAEQRNLLETDERALLRDLRVLPRGACLRRFADLGRRARLVRVRECYLSLPYSGSEAYWQELMSHFDETCVRVCCEQHIWPGDLPNINSMKAMLLILGPKTVRSLRQSHLTSLNTMLNQDLPVLLTTHHRQASAKQLTIITGGAFSSFDESFIWLGRGGEDEQSDDGQNAEEDEEGERGKDVPWAVAADKPDFDKVFSSLSPVNGKISGFPCQTDTDPEFSLASFLVRARLEGQELPTRLPIHLVPPSKRVRQPAESTASCVEVKAAESVANEPVQCDH